MSFSTLNIGASALSAAQRAVEVAAHNVANSTNETYTRQRVTVQASLPTYGTAGSRGDGDRGTGVTVMSISRLRDRLADVSYRSEAGVSGAASARSDTLTRASSVLGTYADGTPEALSTFLAAWDQLSTNPADSSARTSVLSTGQALSDALNAGSKTLDTISGEVSLRVHDDAGELNGLLGAVAKLNGDISRAVVEKREPNDLLDQRDAALDRISALTGARFDAQSDGSVTVTTGSTVLVAGMTAQQVAASSTDPVTVSLQDGTPLSVAGEMGGYVSTAAVDLPSYKAQLDAVALALHDVVNAAHQAGQGSDGSTGLDFFTGTTAATIGIDPGMTAAKVAAAQSGQSGDGNNALAVAAALRTSTASGGTTVAEALRAVGSRVGQAATDATRSANTASSALTSAQAARASADGVSVDDEMVDLVKFQHTYAAAAKVVSIADGMLNTLINDMVK